MGVGTGIEDDTVYGKAYFMDFINNGALMVTLAVGQLHPGI